MPPVPFTGERDSALALLGFAVIFRVQMACLRAELSLSAKPVVGR